MLGDIWKRVNHSDAFSSWCFFALNEGCCVFSHVCCLFHQISHVLEISFLLKAPICLSIDIVWSWSPKEGN